MYPKHLEIIRCPICAPEGNLRAAAVFSWSQDGEVIDAILTCPDCGRWFRVEQGVADLVRDELREVEDERRFLLKHQDGLSIPEVTKPFGLTGSVPQPTEADRRIIDEGRHWGDFMKRFWDVGDRSIFDIRVKGTHPSFYVKGVLEPDDRDLRRPWSNYPAATGRLLFERIDRMGGGYGIDVGCGGGQFGLEAAYRGFRMIGNDPSFGALVLARTHARERGVKNIDYVRAEPAHPPFAAGSLQLLMAKDSLHHVPDLDEVFPRLVTLLEPCGWFITHEHVAVPVRKARLFGKYAERMVRKIRSRYPTVPVPEEFLRDSANEDVSADRIVPLCGKYFSRVASRNDLFLAMEMEMYIHYAFGKRRWFSYIAYFVGLLLERIYLMLGDRQHFSFVGRKRGG